MGGRYRWCAVALCCLAGRLFAQDSVRHDISVEIDVPHSTDTFQVIDIGGWSARVQQMPWDHARQQLMPLRRQLRLKSSGCIKASLSSLPKLSNRDNEIPLAVSIGGIRLPESLDNIEIIGAAGAPTGKVTEFAVEPAGAPTGGYQSGLYQGSISILFENGLGPVDCS